MGAVVLVEATDSRLVSAAPAVGGDPRSLGTNRRVSGVTLAPACGSGVVKVDDFRADHRSETTSNADAAVPASARTWFHAVHRRR